VTGRDLTGFSLGRGRGGEGEGQGKEGELLSKKMKLGSGRGSELSDREGG